MEAANQGGWVMRTRERHTASKAMALEEIEKKIRAQLQAKGNPIPPPNELRRLAEEHFAKHSIHHQ